MSDESEPRPAVVRPDIIQVRVSFPQGSVAIRPNLWYHWTEIALRAEARAKDARTAGLAAAEKKGDWGRYSADETHEAMIVVEATRLALTHLEADWRELGYFDGVTSVDIPGEATTDIPEYLDAWLADIKVLIDDRIRIAHKPQESQIAQPHPAYPSNVSSIASHYTAERASRAVDLLLDFYRRVIESPSDRLAAWAEPRKRVPGDLAEMRSAHTKGSYVWTAEG